MRAVPRGGPRRRCWLAGFPRSKRSKDQSLSWPKESGSGPPSRASGRQGRLLRRAPAAQSRLDRLEGRAEQRAQRQLHSERAPAPRETVWSAREPKDPRATPAPPPTPGPDPGRQISSRQGVRRDAGTSGASTASRTSSGSTGRCPSVRNPARKRREENCPANGEDAVAVAASKISRGLDPPQRGLPARLRDERSSWAAPRSTPRLDDQVRPPASIPGPRSASRRRAPGTEGTRGALRRRSSLDDLFGGGRSPRSPPERPCASRPGARGTAGTLPEACRAGASVLTTAEPSLTLRAQVPPHHEEVAPGIRKRRAWKAARKSAKEVPPSVRARSRSRAARSSGGASSGRRTGTRGSPAGAGPGQRGAGPAHPPGAPSPGEPVDERRTAHVARCQSATSASWNRGALPGVEGCQAGTEQVTTIRRRVVLDDGPRSLPGRAAQATPGRSGPRPRSTGAAPPLRAQEVDRGRGDRGRRARSGAGASPWQDRRTPGAGPPRAAPPADAAASPVPVEGAGDAGRHVVGRDGRVEAVQEPEPPGPRRAAPPRPIPPAAAGPAFSTGAPARAADLRRGPTKPMGRERTHRPTPKAPCTRRAPGREARVAAQGEEVVLASHPLDAPSSASPVAAAPGPGATKAFAGEGDVPEGPGSPPRDLFPNEQGGPREGSPGSRDPPGGPPPTARPGRRGRPRLRSCRRPPPASERASRGPLRRRPPREQTR